MNLTEIKKHILQFAEENDDVNKIVDMLTSDLSDNQKISLMEMFEEDMILHIKNTSSIWEVGIGDQLRKILKSRLFLYSEPEETIQQQEFSNKLDDGSYTSDDFYNHIFFHSNAPLCIKAEKWIDESKHDMAGLIVFQNDLIIKRNQALYSFADKMASKVNLNNIDASNYINELDSKIEKFSAKCDSQSPLYFKDICNQKNILNFIAFSSDLNVSIKDSEYGKYKLSCKLQFDFSRKTFDPCAYSIQIDQCDNTNTFNPNYYPIFMQSFSKINDLETNIKLLYNKLYELREDPKISC